MTTLMTRASKIAADRRRPSGFFAEVAQVVLTLTAAFDSYRPELHYMRGPGPKWHAKHNPTSAASAGDPIPTMAQARAR